MIFTYFSFPAVLAFKLIALTVACGITVYFYILANIPCVFKRVENQYDNITLKESFILHLIVKRHPVAPFYSRGAGPCL